MIDGAPDRKLLDVTWDELLACILFLTQSGEQGSDSLPFPTDDERGRALRSVAIRSRSQILRSRKCLSTRQPRTPLQVGTTAGIVPPG